MKLATLWLLVAAQLCLMAAGNRLKMGPYQWLDKPERTNPIRVADGKTNWVCGLWQWEDENRDKLGLGGIRHATDKRPLPEWKHVYGTVSKVEDSGVVVRMETVAGDFIETVIVVNDNSCPKAGSAYWGYAFDTGKVTGVKINGRERDLRVFDFGLVPTPVE